MTLNGEKVNKYYIGCSEALTFCVDTVVHSQDNSLWGAIAYRLEEEGRTLNRENPVSNPTAVASNLWQV